MLSNCVYSYYDEEEYKEFIKEVLRKFRTSAEYKMWLNMHDRTECAATGLSREIDGVDIELHHYNITLWDWVEIILEKFNEENLPMNTFIICNILADLHLSNCIPCICLSQNVHKQIHTNYDKTIETYPHLLEIVNKGNINKAEQIIEYHVQLLKNILIDEKRALEDEH